MLGTAEARRENERVHVLHEKHLFYSFDGTRYTGDADIYEYGAIKYLTNLKNHVTMNLERFMIRAVFALYPGISRKGIWAIIKFFPLTKRLLRPAFSDSAHFSFLTFFCVFFQCAVKYPSIYTYLHGTLPILHLGYSGRFIRPIVCA